MNAIHLTITPSVYRGRAKNSQAFFFTPTLFRAFLCAGIVLACYIIILYMTAHAQSLLSESYKKKSAVERQQKELQIVLDGRRSLEFLAQTDAAYGLEEIKVARYLELAGPEVVARR